MDNIFEINKDFDFNNLNFSDPILTNNNYFSKISHGNFNKSLYIKLNKCFSKNGIVKTSNKCICELNYIINENNNILEFFENLEKFCLNNVINNKNKWFYNSDNITNSDIEELLKLNSHHNTVERNLRNSLKNFDDLKGPGMDEVDPLVVFEKFYVRDNNKLDTLDNIIDGARTPEEAANEFLTEFDGFDLVKTKEKPVVRESIDDEIKELEETEILGDDEVPRDDKASGGLSYLMGV